MGLVESFDKIAEEAGWDSRCRHTLHPILKLVAKKKKKTNAK